MKRKFVTLALLGIVAALGAQPAVAGTRHATTTKAERHVMSERVRNAHAYAAPPFVNWPGGVPYDEALSPPAGH